MTEIEEMCSVFDTDKSIDYNLGKEIQIKVGCSEYPETIVELTFPIGLLNTMVTIFLDEIERRKKFHNLSEKRANSMIKEFKDKAESLIHED